MVTPPASCSKKFSGALFLMSTTASVTGLSIFHGVPRPESPGCSIPVDGFSCVPALYLRVPSTDDKGRGRENFCCAVFESATFGGSIATAGLCRPFFFPLALPRNSPDLRVSAVFPTVRCGRVFFNSALFSPSYRPHLSERP